MRPGVGGGAQVRAQIELPQVSLPRRNVVWCCREWCTPWLQTVTRQSVFRGGGAEALYPLQAYVM